MFGIMYANNVAQQCMNNSACVWRISYTPADVPLTVDPFPVPYTHSHTQPHIYHREGSDDSDLLPGERFSRRCHRAMESQKEQRRPNESQKEQRRATQSQKEQRRATQSQKSQPDEPWK